MPTLLKKEEKIYCQREAEFYEKGAGKYVVIQGDKVLSYFDSEEDALKAGYNKFDAKKPFLIRKVVNSEDSMHYLSPSELHYGIY